MQLGQARAGSATRGLEWANCSLEGRLWLGLWKIQTKDLQKWQGVVIQESRGALGLAMVLLCSMRKAPAAPAPSPKDQWVPSGEYLRGIEGLAGPPSPKNQWVPSDEYPRKIEGLGEDTEMRSVEGPNISYGTPKTPRSPPGKARPPPAASTTKERPLATRALVMHAAPLKYKPGTCGGGSKETTRG